MGSAPGSGAPSRKSSSVAGSRRSSARSVLSNAPVGSLGRSRRGDYDGDDPAGLDDRNRPISTESAASDEGGQDVRGECGCAPSGRDGHGSAVQSPGHPHNEGVFWRNTSTRQWPGASYSRTTPGLACLPYCLLPTTYYLLRLPTTTTYYLLPTTYYLLPYYLLPTTYYLLPIPTTYYLLPTTYYLLPTTYYLLPTTYYLLPAWVGPGLPRAHSWQPTAD